MAGQLGVAARTASPIVREGFRGAAVGALVVSLWSAAFASQSLHTGVRLADWAIGVALTAAILLLFWLVLGVPSAVVAWIVRRLAGTQAGRRRRVADALLAALRLVGSPSLAIAIGIVVLVWANGGDGPLGMFHFLYFFEIPIVAGAVVGLLVGLGLAIGRAGRPSPSPVRRRLAAAMLMAGVLLATGIGGWAILPGGGGPLVHEAPAALAAVPGLDLPDPSQAGPYAVTTASYGSGRDARRPEYGAEVNWTTPSVDASAALGERTDIGASYARWFWGFDTAHLPINALVWYPTDAPGRLPVALIVHGNHDAGDYSDPGYAYLGEYLASRGIFVASIDENFLNGDTFFDYSGADMGARAWFLLRHLDQLRTWDATPGHPLTARLDFDRVALMGHSRGGEAAAVAAMLEANPSYILGGLPPVPRGFGIRAVIGIAPADGMYKGPGSPVSLHNLDYLAIQGAHDGDLAGFNGLQTYHRVSFGEDLEGERLKVALYSERANHGRFNSVWDYGDAGILSSWMLDRGSMFTPAEQQHFARVVIGAFLARSLQGETGYGGFFREPRAGRAWLPDDVIETHWETSRRIVVEDFATGRIDRERHDATGFETVTSGDPPLRDGTTQRDRATQLVWSGPAHYDIPIDRSVAAAIDPDGSLVFAMVATLDGSAPVDPIVELRAADGQTAAVRLSDVAPGRPLLPTRLWKIDGLGDRYLPAEERVLPAERFLQTYEIELSAFEETTPGFDPTRLVSLSIGFGGAGAVFLDDVAFEPPAAR